MLITYVSKLQNTHIYMYVLYTIKKELNKADCVNIYNVKMKILFDIMYSTLSPSIFPFNHPVALPIDHPKKKKCSH